MTEAVLNRSSKGCMVALESRRGSAWAAVDTGAGRTVLNEARAKHLGVTIQAAVDTVQGAHERALLGSVRVDSLRIGAWL